MLWILLWRFAMRSPSGTDCERSAMNYCQRLGDFPLRSKVRLTPTLRCGSWEAAGMSMVVILLQHATQSPKWRHSNETRERWLLAHDFSDRSTKCSSNSTN